MISNISRIYSCYSSLHNRNKTDTCELKGQDSAYIKEIGSANATIGGGIRYVEGYDPMHYVHNLNDEHTITLYYFLGEYRIR